jgi:uncharacterized protein (DUF4213/DUF364 family)
MYFGMSVSDSYLEATVNLAAVGKLPQYYIIQSNARRASITQLQKNQSRVAELADALASEASEGLPRGGSSPLFGAHC